MLSSLLRFYHLPILLVVAIYVPAACFGVLFFQDKESVTLLVLVAVFLVVYYVAYTPCSRLFRCVKGRFECLVLPMSTWYWVAVSALFVYIFVMMYAIVSSGGVPLVVALGGGGLFEISDARGQFLSALEGGASVLRYVIFILGRSLMPLVLVAAFHHRNYFRYVLAIVLFSLSLVTLEKAAPIFTFLPLILYFLWMRRFKASVVMSVSMLSLIVMLTFLAMGGVKDVFYKGNGVSTQTVPEKVVEMKIPDGMTQVDGPGGREGRFYLLHLAFPNISISTHVKATYGKLIVISNRIMWIPYITAYDWLKFHEDVLGGKLTMGRSISFFHLFYGEPKLPLEKMVYVYEFGASPGGVGASNTIFFVDAKLAFGWVGVIVYCLVFTFCAACIFSTDNVPLKVASVTCFFIASVSSLTATLLSGGLAIYVLLAFLLPRAPSEVAGEDVAQPLVSGKSSL